MKSTKWQINLLVSTLSMSAMCLNWNATHVIQFTFSYLVTFLNTLYLRNHKQYIFWATRNANEIEQSSGLKTQANNAGITWSKMQITKPTRSNVPWSGLWRKSLTKAAYVSHKPKAKAVKITKVSTLIRRCSSMTSDMCEFLVQTFSSLFMSHCHCMALFTSVSLSTCVSSLTCISS